MYQLMNIVIRCSITVLHRGHLLSPLSSILAMHIWQVTACLQGNVITGDVRGPIQTTHSRLPVLPAEGEVIGLPVRSYRLHTQG